MEKKSVALVTGASRGIGRGISKCLLKQGIHLVGVSRKIQQNDLEFNQLAEQAGVRFQAYPMDLMDRSGITGLKEFIIKEFGRLDILVNNAGIAPNKRTDVLELDEADYFKLLELNLNSPVFLDKAMIPLLLKSPNAFLIFITSISADVVSVNRAGYCISKAGLSMYRKILAARLMETNVKVFEIRPGVIETDMTAPVLESYRKKAEQGIIPIGRIGQVGDVVGVLDSLISGAFNYASGSCFEVSGGMDIRVL